MFCHDSGCCVTHCEFEDHDHCADGDCDKKDSLCSVYNFCVEHCIKNFDDNDTDPDHIHCGVSECPKSDNICGYSMHCFDHCTQENHKTCKIVQFT